MHAALPEGERAFQGTTSLERALPVLLVRVSLSEVVGQGEDSFVEREGVWGQEEYIVSSQTTTISGHGVFCISYINIFTFKYTITYM